MSRRDTFIDITVRVEKARGNEVADERWIPSASAVAAEIRDRLEGVDLDTGWIIAEVGT